MARCAAIRRDRAGAQAVEHVVLQHPPLAPRRVRDAQPGAAPEAGPVVGRAGRGDGSQRRDDGNFARGEFMRAYAFPTMLGAALGASAYAVSAPLLFWMSPVVAGLLLAIPIAALTARPSLGRALRRAGLLLTPEERRPPPILERANALAAERPPADTGHPLVRLAGDGALRAAHEEMLHDVPQRRKGDVDVHLAVAMMRIGDAANRAEAIASLSAREAFAVMSSGDALRRLMEVSA